MKTPILVIGSLPFDLTIMPAKAVRGEVEFFQASNLGDANQFVEQKRIGIVVVNLCEESRDERLDWCENKSDKLLILALAKDESEITALEIQFGAKIRYYLTPHSSIEQFFNRISWALELEEHSRTELRLHASEQKLAAVFHSSRDAVLSLNRDLEIVTINKYAQVLVQKLIGVQMDVGMSVVGTFPERIALTWRERAWRAIEGDVFRSEDRFAKDGKVVWIDTGFYPIIEGDNVVGISVLARDITAHKLMEQELRSALERLELTTKIGKISISDWYPKEDSCYFDYNLFTLLGYSEDHSLFELSDPLTIWKKLITREHRVVSCVKLERLISQKKGNFEQEFEMETSAGGRKWIRAMVNVDQSTDTNRFRVLILYIDIDDIKKHEFSEILRQKQFTEADKLSTLGTLSAGVAHEINNPNQFISLNIDLLQKSWSTIRAHLDEHIGDDDGFMINGYPYDEFCDYNDEMILGIQRGAKRIRNIVKTLKDYVRKEDKNYEFERLNLKDVLKSALTLTSNTAHKHTFHFLSHIESDLWVKGHPQKLEQVFVNLIMNALEALTKETQAVVIRSSLQENGNFALVEIIDEGCGINDDNVSKILDPFFTTKQKDGGTGMGLSVVASILDDHSGKIRFGKDDENRTVVSVLIPTDM